MEGEEREIERQGQSVRGSQREREREDQRKRGKEEERDLWRGSEGERQKQSQSVCQTDKQADGGVSEALLVILI